MLLLLIVFVAPAAAPAATITVDSTADPAGATGCALRDAINAANTDANVGNCVGGGTYGNDTIDITATGAITLSSALPDLSTNISIVGPGASQLALDGAGSYRVLSAQNLTTTSVSGLTVRNGKAPVSGGLAFAGGILSGGDMTLDGVVVTGNTAAVNGTPNQVVEVDGGGIASGGTLTLVRSTVSGNHVTVTGSGTAQLFAYGGGIRLYAGGTLMLDRSTVSGNDATATITGGANPSYTRPTGGGIYDDGALTIDRSTIAANSVVGTGGVAPILPNFEIGGGVYEDNEGSFASTSATISGNSAADPGANLALLKGGTLQNTIVANPQGGGTNCGNLLTSNGYNLEDDAEASCGFNAPSHDLIGVDPLLDPAGLANNGGPTQTIALEVESPAVDQGKSFGATVDQRDTGFPRIINSPTIVNATGGDGADIGAFERDSIPPDTLLDFKKIDKTAGKAKFEFSSTKSGSTFMCKLGSKPFKSCNSPKIYTGLDPGKHTFKVEAVDAFGNVDPTPIKQIFHI